MGLRLSVENGSFYILRWTPSMLLFFGSVTCHAFVVDIGLIRLENSFMLGYAGKFIPGQLQ
jgi:hypothetical protein